MHLNKGPLSYSKQTLTSWLTAFASMMTELLGVYMPSMDGLLDNTVFTYCNVLSCVPDASQTTVPCSSGMRKEPALGLYSHILIYIQDTLAWFLVIGQEVSMYSCFTWIFFVYQLCSISLFFYISHYVLCFTKWPNSEKVSEEISICLKVY